MKQITGGELIVQALKNEGVDTVFGIIDGSYLALNLAFRKYGINLVTPRHETCAVHMAGAYARLTGKLGVCIASSGPGVANALPGVIVENAEGNRILLITSSRRTGAGNPERLGVYQYFDQAGVIRPGAKFSAGIPSFERIPEFIYRSFRSSFSGRPGVVHIDIPENIINGKHNPVALTSPDSYRRTEAIAPSSVLVEQAAELLIKARKPLIHAGSGVIHSGAFEELKAVAELLQSPVSASWGGRAAFDERSDLSIGMPYVDLLDTVRTASDLLLVIGSRLGETDWWGKAPNWGTKPHQKTIQVDADEQMLGLNKPVDLAIHSDAKAFLSALHAALIKRKDSINIRRNSTTAAKYAAEKKRQRSSLDRRLKDRSSPLLSGHVPVIAQSIFKNDAVLVVDGGNTTIWGLFYHEIRHPNTLLMTSKFGMLGAGVPQALGAAAAYPDRQVYCIIGDGAMGFNIQEIETAVRNNLRVIFLVLCDKQWGMVKMTQQFAIDKWKTIAYKSLPAGTTFNTDLGEIKFNLLAESFGAHGERVNSPDDLPGAIERSIASGKTSIIHIDVDPVKHLWAPKLMTFKKLHQEPAGR